MSEFGMQSCPAPATLEAVIPEAERYPLSYTMELHNKAPDGPRRLAAYLSDIVRSPGETLADYSYNTQLLQAEAIGYAYRLWRRRWHGPGRYAVAGALVWQLNDCWPVVSWAIVDHALRPKAALYAIGRELRPVTVAIDDEGTGSVIWGVNATDQPVTATLESVYCELDGKLLVESRREVQLPPLGSTTLAVRVDSGYAPGVQVARLIVDGAVIARAALWPEPLKHFPLPDPGLTVTNLGDDRVELRCQRPAKGVWLDGGDEIDWEDNYVDLIPDEPRVIAARGLGTRQVHARHL